MLIKCLKYVTVKTKNNITIQRNRNFYLDKTFKNFREISEYEQFNQNFSSTNSLKLQKESIFKSIQFYSICMRNIVKSYSPTFFAKKSINELISYKFSHDSKIRSDSKIFINDKINLINSVISISQVSAFNLRFIYGNILKNNKSSTKKRCIDFFYHRYISNHGRKFELSSIYNFYTSKQYFRFRPSSQNFGLRQFSTLHNKTVLDRNISNDYTELSSRKRYPEELLLSEETKDLEHYEFLKGRPQRTTVRERYETGEIHHWWKPFMARFKARIDRILNRTHIILEIRDARAPFTTAPSEILDSASSHSGYSSLINSLYKVGTDLPDIRPKLLSRKIRRIIVLNRSSSVQTEVLSKYIEAIRLVTLDPVIAVDCKEKIGFTTLLNMLEKYYNSNARLGSDTRLKTYFKYRLKYNMSKMVYRSLGVQTCVIGLPNIGKSRVIKELQSLSSRRRGDIKRDMNKSLGQITLRNRMRIWRYYSQNPEQWKDSWIWLRNHNKKKYKLS